MNNKTITLSRDLVEQAANLIETHPSSPARSCSDELRAALAEPVFEPVESMTPLFYFVECDDPSYRGLYNHESEAQTQANKHGGEVIKLWNVPPTWKPTPQSQGEPTAYLCDGSSRAFLARDKPEAVWNNGRPRYLHPSESSAPSQVAFGPSAGTMIITAIALSACLWGLIYAVYVGMTS